MAKTGALAQFAALARGEPPADVDWTAVLALANQSLTTPLLAAAAAAAPFEPLWPAEVRVFLADVAARTTARNRRLRDQLVEAVAILNAAGVTPILLKGSAMLLDEPAWSRRLLTDLDLMVAPGRVDAARAALTRHGFEVADAHPDPNHHVAVELFRPQDPGVIDLHRRPPAPPAMQDAADVLRTCSLLEWSGGRVLVPDPATALLTLVWHDQFHDGDHWHGWLDLRHLADIAAATRKADLDWRAVQAGCRGGLARTALASHLLAARDLFGAQVPSELLVGVRPSLHHWRRLLQARRPSLAPLFTAAALTIEAPAVLRHFGRRPAAQGGQGRVAFRERASNLLRPANPGKV